MNYSIPITPTEDISSFTITWSLPEETPLNTVKEVKYKPFKLLSEEVWELTQEWYRSQNQNVPKEEMLACLAEIQKEKKENQKPIQVAKGGFDGKPDYGTKEFWAQVWAKKKAAGYVSKKEQKEKEKQNASVSKN